MFPESLLAAAGEVLARCREGGLRVATVESCTGGLVAGCLTAIAGSSSVVDRAWVTYTEQAKSEMVGVPGALIEARGVVSEEVARAMAEGALSRSAADVAVSVTGVAGPGGGGEGRPVGLVHLVCARRGRPTLHERHVFEGDRGSVRLGAVERALAMLLEQAAG